MRISRIYVDQSLDLAHPVQLDSDRAHYVSHVLRLKTGAPLIVFNGLGGEYAGHIEKISRAKVTIQLENFTHLNKNSKLNIEIGLALIKRDAMDYAIQKATELGVTSIQPLNCDNTSIPTRNLEKKMRHWQQVANSACEQCGSNSIPTIKPAVRFTDWHCSNFDLRLIAIPEAHALGVDLSQLKLIPSQVVVAIGPEGGFSTTEIERA